MRHFSGTSNTHVTDYSLGSLQVQREIALVQARDVIEDRIEWFASRVCRSCSSKMTQTAVSEFVARLSTSNLLVSSKRNVTPIGKLVEKMKQLGCIRHTNGIYSGCCARCPMNFADVDTQFDLSGAAQKILDDISVPCLACLRQGESQLVNACNHK